MSRVNIAGIDKAVLLAALFNRSFQQGIGVTVPASAGMMDIKQAGELIHEHGQDGDDLYFDYLLGRVMKISLSEDLMCTRLYNRDLGKDAAEQIVSSIRAEMAQAEGQ